MTVTPDHPGAATGPVRAFLRLEGLAALVLATLLYAQGGYSWVLFAILFLTPDLSFLAYLAGPRAGAAAYNAVHSYAGPLLLAAALLLLHLPLAVPLIWTAHIGIDRLLGYGLKYRTGFADTHLGRLARRPAPATEDRPARPSRPHPHPPTPPSP
jgi:hypothetical protein